MNDVEELTEADRQALRDGARADTALRKIWAIARDQGSVSESQVNQIIADSLELSA